MIQLIVIKKEKKNYSMKKGINFYFINVNIYFIVYSVFSC